MIADPRLLRLLRLVRESVEDDLRAERALRGLAELVVAPVLLIAPDRALVSPSVDPALRARIEAAAGREWNDAPRALQPGVHRRAELVGNTTWYGSNHFFETRKPTALDDTIYVELDGLGRFALIRRDDAPPFTPDERALVEVFFSECAWLLEDRSPAIPSRPLPPRQRATLECLLAGYCEKETAAKLGLSTHTVHGYVKALYKTFAVTSRAELMAAHLHRRGRAA